MRVVLLLCILFPCLAFSQHIPAKTILTNKNYDSALIKAREMQLDELIGNLFVITVWGDTDASQEVYRNFNLDEFGFETVPEIITHYHPAGVLLYKRTGNLESAKRIRELTASIQTVSSKANSLPLLIATDQEMGIAHRLPEGFTRFSGNLALGIANDPKLAEDAAFVTGEELSGVGVNTVFAPVLDLENGDGFIGSRSIGADPKVVGMLGSQEVRGFERAGVRTFIKHFPGHGIFKGDTHLEAPCIEDVSLEALKQRDFFPFRQAIEAGASGLMLAHFGVRAIDSACAPSSASLPAVSLARNDLGLRGPIITDSIRMLNGKATEVESADLIMQSLNAGVDLVLRPLHLGAVVTSLTSAVDSGKLSRTELERSVARTLLLRQAIKLNSNTALEQKRFLEIGSPAHQTVAKTLVNKSVRWINALPKGFKLQKKVLVFGFDGPSSELLMQTLERTGHQAELLSPTKSFKFKSDLRISDANTLPLFLFKNAGKNPGQIEALQEVQNLNKNSVVFEIGIPAISIPSINHVPQIGLYDSNLISMTKAVQILFKNEPTP